MGYDGSGNYNRLYNWQDDAANNIDIRADRMDAEFDEIATALSMVVVRDGQGAMQADFDFGNFRALRVGDPNIDTDGMSRGYADARYMGKTGNQTLTGDFTAERIIADFEGSASNPSLRLGYESGSIYGFRTHDANNRTIAVVDGVDSYYFEKQTTGAPHGLSAMTRDMVENYGDGRWASISGEEFTGPIGIPAGTVAAPGLYFNTDGNTGLYHEGDTSSPIYFAKDGNEAGRLSGGTTYSTGTEITTKAKADLAYLGINSQADDSDKVDGLHASSFLRADADDNNGSNTLTIFEMVLGKAGSGADPTLKFDFYNNSTGIHPNSDNGLTFAINGNNLFKMDPGQPLIDDEHVLVKKHLDDYLANDYDTEPMSRHSNNTGANLTDFPYGAVLLCLTEGNNVNRRASHNVYYDSANSRRYTLNSTGNVRITGTWRSCGSIQGDDNVLMQRIS